MAEVVTLPDPQREGQMSLEAALERRHSVREFSTEPLTMEDISQLLWSAQGITDASGHRTSPSAGATYPLELYLVTGDGVFHYIPQDHTLHRVREGDLRRDLFDASLEQEFILEAPATIVFTAVFARTEQRYGSTRSPRYVHVEVGHAAQNVLLQAVALGLGAVPVGAYEDKRVSSVLHLPADQAPLYLISVGHPR
ncbi:MAG: SagB/ThcOx family dehydrogenase [Anaerolineae bacterium]|nr:MAG: SagB/ThcOx family dehydrogenase [Anaerolineae bacterium]